MQDPQGWNPYAYVHNDPVNYSDPLGLDRCPANDPNCIEVNDTYDRIGTILGPLNRLHETSSQAQIDKLQGRDPLQEQGIGPCELMARKAEQIIGRNPAMSVETFDEQFGKFYVGTNTTDSPDSPIAMWLQAFVLQTANKSARGRFVGQSDFALEYHDKVDSDQTHHFAAYLSLGIHGHLDYALAHATGDRLQMNPGDARLGMAAFGLGEHLRANPKDLQFFGDMIRNFCRSQD